MKRVIQYLLLLAVLGGFLYTLYYLYQKNQEPDTVYETVAPEERTIIRQTVAAGSVVPREEILIKPVVSGIIDELFVEAGDVVKKGDLIARIKIIPDMVSLNAAENRVERSKISLDNARIDFERNKTLFDQDVISAADLQPFELAFNNAKLEVVAAEDNLLIIKEGVSKSAENATNTLVRSTITGMVLDVPVKQGNQVIEANTFNEGTTIASVANMGEMIFEGFLDEAEVGKVRENMELIITIGALSDQTFRADLEYIAPKGTDQDGTIQFQVKAALLKGDSTFIRAGYSANAAIVLDKREQVLSIEESVLHFEDDSVYVFVETGNQQFEKRLVELGLSDGIYTEVLTGITSDDRLRGREKRLPS